MNRILNEHHRTTTVIRESTAVVHCTLRQVKQARSDCSKAIEDYRSAEEAVNSSLRSSLKEETRRVDAIEYLNRFNAGKPLGWF